MRAVLFPLVATCLASALLSLSAPAVSAADTVSLVLVDGDMREDWPDHGVVGFRRQNTDTALIVNFTLSGTAQTPGEYSVVADPALTSATSITIPQGDREAWIEFAPTGQPFVLPPKALFKTIVVTLQSGADYSISPIKGAAGATVTLANPSPLPCAKAAVRFLQQAAFGADNDLKNVQEVMTKGFSKWLDDQFKKPVGLQQPYIISLGKRADADSKSIAWWNRVMNTGVSSDPLRQRVGFALSEIMVISDGLDELANQPAGMMNYYDMLLKAAFGNYRDLLYQVGTHPCMGVYLSHLQNQKPDPVAGTFADENFAREIMQLFSIGIWQLNPDGTRVLDDKQEPIPTYNNATVAAMARVMTGFSFGGPKAKDFFDAPDNWVTPMRMWDEFHDVDAKTIIGGVELPARTASNPDRGLAGLADYNAAIDALFHHANTAPFICKQLIQKLVTSNPTPGYVSRVGAKFVDNGNGVRGDLAAVIRAILLDPEARDPSAPVQPSPSVAPGLASGKLKEPYLRTANLIRALHARAANGIYELDQLGDIHFQQPLSAPSVFNFFKPGFAPDGAVSDAGLVAPEFQIVNAVTALSIPNYYLDALENGFNRWGAAHASELVRAPLTAELALVNDVPALLRRLDLLLTGGTLPREQHQIIREAVEQIDSTFYLWKLARVRLAIYLIATSPEFAILK